MYVTTNTKQIVERTDKITFELISVTFGKIDRRKVCAVAMLLKGKQ